LLQALDENGAPAREVVSLGGAAPAELLLSLENIHGWEALRAGLKGRFGNDLDCREGLGAVSVVGIGINADSAHLCRALAALDRLSVPVHGIHTGALRVLVLLPADRVKEAVRCLHDEFLGGDG
jgi:aspartokinase